MHRKAQWFIVGAITLMTMMVLVTVSKTQVKIGQDIEPWQKYIFRNLKAESAAAINSMVQESATSGNVEERSRDYLGFLRSFGDSHGVGVSAYFIIGLPADNSVNISVINSMQNELRDISITLNGTTQTIPVLADRDSARIVFTNVPEYFAVNYTLIEMNASGGQETESSSFSTTKKAFYATKLRVKSKDGSQIWQGVEWN